MTTFEVYVPLCSRTVTVSMIGERRFRVSPIIWHPNVFARDDIGILDDGESPEELLTRTTSSGCPANVDANCQIFRGERAAFEKTNQDLEDRVINVSECCVCFENVQSSEKQILCYAFHWVCKDCSPKVNKCPFCRK